ncbi:hypothetical protein [Nocardia mexicana]|uniref:hypothetical protein n=1 Tax=Nocardia mexicana TaxID=279262 RepID=UPI0011C03E51|nr:hypothetical protein [Nocardia mexicana]
MATAKETTKAEEQEQDTVEAKGGEQDTRQPADAAETGKVSGAASRSSGDVGDSSGGKRLSAAGAKASLSDASRRVTYLLVALVIVLIATAGVLAYQWRSSASDLSTLRQQNADRAHAAELAKDYTLRSLTYDYNNLPAFFDGVQRDTSEALRKRYADVHDTLAKIMTEAHVVATGQVVATAVEPTGNNQYTVTVFATQRTQNIQQPEPATTPNLLSVTVAGTGNSWQVTDYGPK